MADQTWDGLHTFYSQQDWIDKPNIFADQVLEYFPKSGRLLSLGDGQGQDSRYFAQKGFEVMATDLADKALETSLQRAKEEQIANLVIQKLDLQETFSFEDETFDIVYAHLSLHYFSTPKTEQIFGEIWRVLKEGGIFAAFVNSVNDPEFNTGTRIEQEFFEIEGMTKRFFSVFSMEHFTKGFQVVLLDDKGETYKDSAKGIHNLVRFVGRK